MVLRGPPPPDERCVDAADLTAFATDALPAARRAAVSRHVLRCARCRATLDRDAAMLARLRGFARAPSWEDDVGAAMLARGARGRARVRGAAGGAVAAAALVAAWVLAPGEPGPAAPPV